MSNKIGGYTEWGEPDEMCQKLADRCKNKAEIIMKEKYSKFKVVSCRSAVVSGMLFNLKIDVGNDSLLRLNLFEKPWVKNSLEIQRVGYDNKNVD